MDETGLKEGDTIEVKLIGLDPKTNKLKLSRKGAAAQARRAMWSASAVRAASVAAEVAVASVGAPVPDAPDLKNPQGILHI